jgi:hypothetical protein
MGAGRGGGDARQIDKQDRWGAATRWKTALAAERGAAASRCRLRRMRACTGRSRASNSALADGRNSIRQVKLRRRDRPPSRRPDRARYPQSECRPAGGLPFADSLVRRPGPIFVFRLQILNRHHSGDWFPITNEDHALLIAFGARRCLGKPIGSPFSRQWEREDG